MLLYAFLIGYVVFNVTVTISFFFFYLKNLENLSLYVNVKFLLIVFVTFIIFSIYQVSGLFSMSFTTELVSFVNPFNNKALINNRAETDNTVEKNGNPREFSDSFERANSPFLGSSWTSCSESSSSYFEPLGIYDGGVVVTDPKTRSGTYDTTPPSGHPPTEDRIHPGIGCAWVDTGLTKVSVKAVWSGNLGLSGSAPKSHVEGSPLLYISPNTTRYGFGAWPSEIYGVPVLLVGYIGGPPENFEIIGVSPIPGGHITGTLREIELRAKEAGKVTVWVDGVQASFSGGYGYNPITVDPLMVSSTLHGIAVDAHYVDPVSVIPQIKAFESFSITEL